MSRTQTVWQSAMIPMALMITVSLSTAPGRPLLVHTQSNVGDVMDKSQTTNDENWVNKNKSLRILSDIQGLKKNWDGYGAESIPADVILLARSIVVALNHQPEIYPTKRRTVQMQYELRDRSYLELEIYADKIEALSVPQRKYEKAHEYTISANKYYEISDMVDSFYS